MAWLWPLWFWLFAFPVAIGLWFDRWPGCLAALVTYLLLFDLGTVVISIADARLGDILGLILRDDLMILAVALSTHGLRQALRSPES